MTPRRVLVVDDDAGLREILGATLVELGVEVLEAADAASALALLERGRFEAVFCDHLLGGKTTGLSLLISARARGLLDGTRCVLLTGLPVAVSVSWLNVLQKPFDFRALCEIAGGKVR